MSMRELVVLGTASQAPTRQRNHNGYLLRWDDEVILFDPGEGSQRQMLHTGVTATDLTRICVTHFHGDHCLGLPGMIQRLSLDRVPHPVAVHFPAGGADYFARLRHASSFYETAELAVEPIDTDGQRITLGIGTLEARRLRHPVETYGYRLVEPDGCRMLPERLAAYGIVGPAVGRLLRDGHLDLDGRRVSRDEVSVTRPGQRFAFVMDTGLCDGAYALAEHADLLVIESTFLESEAALAAEVGHLTAGQAARVAAESGVRTLVLTHFSQRYADPRRFHDEAREHFTGDLVIAEDLQTVQMPPRRVPSPG
ncbi:ribonuclease Z [Micromonospora sp. WMMA1996]|uniref:ribonuclease Z n=1 Tax=Micromonospora sp. WMMA1996 TaxID=2039878 RepID=UPI000BF8FFE4|nr:ribonuclease Z [Micromonospora sp. WMMA1996]PGH43413.1 ribonuclease Z [Micromonospora sp. WMMA1996]